MIQSELNEKIIEIVKQYNKDNNCVIDDIKLNYRERNWADGKVSVDDYDCTVTIKNHRI